MDDANHAAPKQVSWRILEELRDRLKIQAIHNKTTTELLVAKWLEERLDIEESPKKSRKK